MRTAKFSLVMTGLWPVLFTACATSGSAERPGSSPKPTTAKGATSKGAAKPSGTARPAVFTAKDNPTAKDGRGDPDLEDFFRPAAWVYVGGRGGRFLAKDGKPQVQWMIDGPVSAAPTFRVEAYEPLFGKPKDLSCILDTVESNGGTPSYYGFAAKPGAFQVGREYSLLKPGDEFVVRNRATGDIVAEIPSLDPGTYSLIAAVKNLQTGKEGVAITYFTVGPSGSSE